MNEYEEAVELFETLQSASEDVIRAGHDAWPLINIMEQTYNDHILPVVLGEKNE